MAKKQAVQIPNDDFLKEAVTEYKPLPKGKYPLTITEVSHTEVKQGAHAGKSALNVQFKHEQSGRIFYKLIPLFVVTPETDEKTLTWVKMARVTFVEAFTPTIPNSTLFINPEQYVGQTVTAVIDSKVNQGYGLQNFIVKFA